MKEVQSQCIRRKKGLEFRRHQRKPAIFAVFVMVGAFSVRAVLLNVAVVDGGVVVVVVVGMMMWWMPLAGVVVVEERFGPHLLL